MLAKKANHSMIGSSIEAEREGEFPLRPKNMWLLMTSAMLNPLNMSIDAYLFPMPITDFYHVKERKKKIQLKLGIFEKYLETMPSILLSSKVDATLAILTSIGKPSFV
jgi:hypothetical protein